MNETACPKRIALKVDCSAIRVTGFRGDECGKGSVAVASHVMRSEIRQAVIIRNPRARRAPEERALIDAADPLRKAGWSVEVVTTTTEGQATELAALAARNGSDLVVACGGDGTVHEVANGLARTGTVLGVAPAGTADVWAREALIPRDTIAALELLPTMQRKRIDLGMVNGRYFLLMCSIGLDADVVGRVIEWPRSKRWLGRVAYVLAGAGVAFTGSSTKVEISMNGDSLVRNMLMAVAGNTRLYGGAVRITDAALIDDGLLDLCVFHEPSGNDGLVSRAKLVLRVIRGGVNKRGGHGIDYRRANQISMITDRVLPVQADGEIIGETPVDLSVVPGALTVLVAPHPNPLFVGSEI